ncbi:DNA-binding protein [Deefgea rivuli]|uniref:DNA-binding protein n=1 Tax=Deefgea rivuli TaxID=400948 RepID=UPI0004880669|nr:DNA-binding protein [Deefgea rivuli]
MDIDQAIRERVLVAAKALYEESGRVDFPTVAAVRSKAGVDMNAASVVMKEWRRLQTTTAAPVEVVVPPAVLQAAQVLVANLWKDAQDLANESLLAAQSGWDAERAEAETLRSQLSEAFEGVLAEFEALQAQLADCEKALDDAQLLIQHEQTANRELQSEKSALQSVYGTEIARNEELERRIVDLRAELDRTHMDKQSADLDRQSAIAERDELRVQFVDLNQRLNVAVQSAHTAAALLSQAESRIVAAEGREAVLYSELREARTLQEQIRTEAAHHVEVAAQRAGELDALRGFLARFTPPSTALPG